MTTDLRRPTATDPWIIRASDGAAIYNLPDKAQLPAALDSGALKVKEQVPLTEISLSAATLAALETVNAVISDGGATISIDDGAASITVDGSVALDAGTLAALETINAVVSGTVALDSTALAALETIELGGTSLAALESITVVGALTDAELRASPVPVSGTVTTGGLTDTQLRATPVSVEQATSVDVADGGGSLTVDGPATDAQLRATPLPVSGTVTTAGLTDTQLRATPVPISVDAAALAALETTELGATTLAALETINAVISDGGGTITVDDGAASLTVDGTVALDATTLAALETVNAVISGEVALDAPSLAALETIELGATSLAALESITATGPLTDTQLRATPVPVSGTVTTGGLTDTQLRATPVSVEQATSVDVADGGGSLTVDSAQLPSALATDRLKVDGSGVTQPVSGTVTASGPLTDTQLRASAVSVEQATSVTVDAGTGPFPVSDNAGSLTVDSPGLPVALDGVSLKVKEQSPLTQPLTDAQLAARLPLSVEQATSVAATVDQASVTTGSITSGSGASSRVDTACTGYPVCSVVLAGTYNIPLLQIEGSDDGGTTFPHTLQYWSGYDSPAIGAFAPTANQAYLFRVDTLGMTHVRVRASAYTSGTGQVRVTPVAGAYPVPGFQAVDTELGPPVTAADGLVPGTYTGPVVVAEQLAYNGSTFDMFRANTDGTPLASSARTTTAGGTSADRVNYNARGVHIAINITNIVTACSIQPNIQGKDVVSGVYYKLAADPTAITATGLYVYEFYPGASTAAAGGITARVAASVPRTWRVIVTHNNANAITYSVGCSLIL